MMRKKITISLVLLLCISLVVGCNSEKEEQTSSVKESIILTTTENETLKEETFGETTSIEESSEETTSQQISTEETTTKRNESAEKESVEKAAAEKVAAEKAAAEKAAAEKAAAEKAAAEKAAAEKAAKNPKMHLKINQGSIDDGRYDEIYVFERKEADGCVTFYDLRFYEDGICESVMDKYISLNYWESEQGEMPEHIFEYKGEQFFEVVTGLFFDGVYNLTDEKIYISVGEEANIVLTMTKDGNVVVESVVSNNVILEEEMSDGNMYVYKK